MTLTDPIPFTLPPAADAPPPPSALHAIADEYERWLPYHEVGQQIIEDPDQSDDVLVMRMAFAITTSVEAKLKGLRDMLSALAAADLGEVARKARIFRVDSSSWGPDPDPLHRSICDDVLRITGVQPLPEPLAVPAEVFQHVRDSPFAAPPLPWEEEP